MSIILRKGEAEPLEKGIDEGEVEGVLSNHGREKYPGHNDLPLIIFKRCWHL